MRTVRIGGIAVAALLVLGCGKVKLPELSARGDDAAKAAITEANGRIRDANAAMAAKKPGKETKAFVDEVTKLVQAFNKDTASPDVARVASLGHAAGVLGQAVGAGPDRPLEAALAYFAKRVGDEPARWGGELEQLAAVLDLHGAQRSREVASELRAFSAQLALDVSAIQAAAGPQAPCRAGAAEQAVGVAAGQLVAAGLAAARPSSDTGWKASLEPSALCRAEPAQLVLSRAQAPGQLVPTIPTLAVLGLNLQAAPAATVRDAAGQPIAVTLAPVVKPTSRVEIPLNAVSFPAEPPPTGARIVLALQGGAPSELSVPILTGVKAEFDGIPLQGDAPLQVMFSDRSVGSPTAWRWDFGDGGAATVQHPKHLFARPGSFTVQLAVTRPDSSDTAVKQGFVTVRAPPLGTKILPPVVPGPAPATVVFRQEPTRPVNSVCWTFSDGPATVCQAQIPHTFQNAGTFTATVKVKDDFGTEATASAQVVVAAPPLAASFEPSPASGICPLTVQFRNTSQHPEAGTSWRWVFADTGGIASSHDVTHVFNRSGNHTVTVTASYQTRQSAATKVVSVQPPPPAVLYHQVYTRQAALGPTNIDWDVSPQNCGAGYRRGECRAAKVGGTNATCAAAWRTADPHDCRCGVRVVISPLAVINCEIHATKVNEACAL